MGRETMTLVGVLLICGCATSKPSAREGWGHAVLLTTAIVLASVAQQAGAPANATGTFPGELPPCYPGCGAGFSCNLETETCERPSCGGKCHADQVCDRTGMLETCVGPWPVGTTPLLSGQRLTPG